MARRAETAGRGLIGWKSVVGLAGVAGVGAALLRRGGRVAKVAPDLRAASMLLAPPLSPALIPLIRAGLRRAAPRVAVPPGVRLSRHQVTASPGAAPVRVMTLQRENHAAGGPALVWLHGGGYLIGTPEIDMTLLARILDGADVTIFSVDYRLAPRDRFPAALDDAVEVLRWVRRHADALGIDPDRIAVGGNSAGGGLAASLAQRAHDENIPLVFQLLMYPMLDDRTALQSDHGGRGALVWTPDNNRHGWVSYLGGPLGPGPLPDYAAAARRPDLAGLPPAWIGVGSLDLFCPEDAAYAERLRAAGVRCTLDIVDDAPHAFDLLNFESGTARGFHEGMITALRDAFDTGGKDAPVAAQ